MILNSYLLIDLKRSMGEMTTEVLCLLALLDYGDLEEVLAELDLEPIDALMVLFDAGLIDEERLKEMVGL